MKFRKIREEIEKLGRYDGRTRWLSNLDKIESISTSGKVAKVVKIELTHSITWGADGMEISVAGEYSDADWDTPPQPIESRLVTDENVNKEAAAICDVLNQIPELRYELCIIQEKYLSGELPGNREAYFPEAISNGLVPCFMVTRGVAGLKQAMESLGFHCTGNATLTFERKEKGKWQSTT